MGSCCSIRARAHGDRSGGWMLDEDREGGSDTGGRRSHSPCMQRRRQQGGSNHVPLNARELLGAEDLSPDPDEACAKEGRAGGGFRWNTPERIKEVKDRRAVVWKWVRGFGGVIFKDGVNLTKVSLPVELFEGKSFLQRLPESWVHMDLLRMAADAVDPVERMRCIVAWVLSGLSCQVSAFKPFNPILGETYSAVYKDGTKLFVEQSSHHPPVSVWQMVDARGKFLFEGVANYEATTKPNSVRARQLGTNRLTFLADDTFVTWELPELYVLNVMFGEMHLKYRGLVVFEDTKSGVRCEVEVDPPRPGNAFSRTFRRGTLQDIDTWHQDMLVGSIKVHGKPVDAISGSWLDHITWLRGDSGVPKKYFEYGVTDQERPEPSRHPLPSDSRFREDVQHLIRGDLKGAAKWKANLEQLQRADRQNRGTAG